MAAKKKEATTRAKKTAEQDLKVSEYLRKVFAEADASLEHFLNLKKLYDKQGKFGDQFQNNFLSFIQRDLDLLKILNLMTNAPLGLTKGQIGQYVMADKYKGKGTSEKTEKQMIMKNLNSIEKNIAHLSALLYMFFPNHRDALGIVRDEEKTQGKAFRYRFNDVETAGKIFSDLVRFDDELAFTHAITEKTRNEISETCIEDVVNELTEDASENKELYRKILNKLIRAIENHTLCEIESYDSLNPETFQKYAIKSDLHRFYYLPLMIRDVSENNFDRISFYHSNFQSSKEILYKYHHMNSSYVVHGLVFMGNSKRAITEDEWFRSATEAIFRFSGIKNLKFKNDLSEDRLKVSSLYNRYTGSAFNLNPYRNLCHKDFYLLIPTAFLKRIPPALKQSCFNFQDGSTNLEAEAKNWLTEYSESLKERRTLAEVTSLKFNMDYYDKNEKYSLVKCKNYAEFLHQLNHNHIVLPDCTLPRELVIRQSMLFTRSMLKKHMLASPHQALLNEKEIRVRRHFNVISSDEVFRYSAFEYENKKNSTYLNKFGYKDLVPLRYEVDENTFCGEICRLMYRENRMSRITPILKGIPLCLREENGSVNLVFWNITEIIRKHPFRDNGSPRLSVAEEIAQFIIATNLEEDYFQDECRNISLELMSIPLSAHFTLQPLNRDTNTDLLQDSQGNQRQYLSEQAKSILMNYVETQCQPTPRFDDLSHTRRTYYVFFERRYFDEVVFVPDCFDNVEVYDTAARFMKNTDVPQPVRIMLRQYEKEQAIGIISFETHKRSEVLRFLHENMGRVFYLDMSEDSSDPLRIYEELKADNEKLMSVCDLK